VCPNPSGAASKQKQNCQNGNGHPHQPQQQPTHFPVLMRLLDLYFHKGLKQPAAGNGHSP
jgi:hypothetical protein